MRWDLLELYVHQGEWLKPWCDVVIKMVIAVRETMGQKWPVWRWWLKWVAVSSVIFAGIWWAVSRDLKGTLIAASIPWGFAVYGLVLSLVWAVVLIPLMTIVGKVCGKRTSR